MQAIINFIFLIAIYLFFHLRIITYLFIKFFLVVELLELILTVAVLQAAVWEKEHALYFEIHMHMYTHIHTLIMPILFISILTIIFVYLIFTVYESTMKTTEIGPLENFQL